jgi:hypothetical protein
MTEMTREEMNQAYVDARSLAKKAGLTMRGVGCGLFRLQGQDHLMPPSQIVKLLSEPSGPRRARKVRSDKGKTHQRRTDRFVDMTTT